MSSDIFMTPITLENAEKYFASSEKIASIYVSVKYQSPMIHRRDGADLRRELLKRKTSSNVCHDEFKQDVFTCVVLYLTKGHDIDRSIQNATNPSAKQRLWLLKTKYGITNRLTNNHLAINLPSFATIHPYIAADVLTSIEESNLALNVSPTEMRRHVPGFPIVLMNFSIAGLIPKEDTDNCNAHDTVLKAVKLYVGYETCKLNKEAAVNPREGFRRGSQYAEMSYQSMAVNESDRVKLVRGNIFKDVYEILQDGKLAARPVVMTAAKKFDSLYA